jgi:hypothetical protein
MTRRRDRGRARGGCGRFRCRLTCSTLVAGGALGIGDQPGDDEDVCGSISMPCSSSRRCISFSRARPGRGCRPPGRRCRAGRARWPGRSTRAGRGWRCEDHRDAGQEPLEVGRVGGFENVRAAGVRVSRMRADGSCPSRVRSPASCSVWLRRRVQAASCGLGGAGSRPPGEPPGAKLADGVANAVVEHQLLAAVLMHAAGSTCMRLSPFSRCLEEFTG